MNRNKSIKRVIAGMIGVVLVTTSISADAREWKDKKGNTVEAEYVGYEKGAQGMIIKLKSPKGDIKLPFNLLWMNN